MTLTVAQVREYVGTSLSDAAVQRLLDSSYAAINGHIGASGNRIELLRGSGALLMLSQPASAIVSVTEDVRGANELLNASDYALRPSGTLLERLDTGPNPRSWWSGLVSVVSTPTVIEADRDRVAIELLKFDLMYNPGLASQSSDSWSESYTQSRSEGWDYATGRTAILSTLSRPLVLL